MHNKKRLKIKRLARQHSATQKGVMVSNCHSDPSIISHIRVTRQLLIIFVNGRFKEEMDGLLRAMQAHGISLLMDERELELVNETNDSLKIYPLRLQDDRGEDQDITPRDLNHIFKFIKDYQKDASTRVRFGPGLLSHRYWFHYLTSFGMNSYDTRTVFFPTEIMGKLTAAYEQHERLDYQVPGSVQYIYRYLLESGFITGRLFQQQLVLIGDGAHDKVNKPSIDDPSCHNLQLAKINHEEFMAAKNWPRHIPMFLVAGTLAKQFGAFNALSNCFRRRRAQQPVQAEHPDQNVAGHPVRLRARQVRVH